MKYSMMIDSNKWKKISDVKLENETPYWCKMTNGQIVMAALYLNEYSSGMTKCFVDKEGIKIKTNEFYILKGSFVQPVIEIE